MQDSRRLIVLNSITHAHRAREYLSRMGIRSYLERIPEKLRTTGCGYGVRVVGYADIAARMLEEAGIPVRDIIDLNAPGGDDYYSYGNRPY